ncbi:AlkA N-terminal domain-containing protein [Fusobacterium varium]|uniref:AlkA N-terminal domain-containing protein n=1 Tax=Fusobacterium varium TaxID=856 RepID=UPI0035689019
MMLKDKKYAWYMAFKAKDTRFDGRFFVGVSSTKVYCRPVCRAKMPKFENCTFFSTAAAAEQAGYRPCLICRPELAPGTSVTDATASLVRHAAKVLEEECGNGDSIEETASHLGCTSRHLRRVFVSEYNVTPTQYLQTCRLLLAKSLLTDTNLSVLEVAMAAGFGSLRRFNDVFKKQYKLVPTALRKQAGNEKKQTDEITLALGYRPPYQWEHMLTFLATRAIPGVEIVKDNKYYRTVHFINEKQHIHGCIQVGHQPVGNTLKVTMSADLLPVLSQVLARVRHLFDLSCDPYAVYQALESMNEINPELCVLGIRVPGCFNPFEMAVRAVLGQQITIKAARTLAARLTENFGTPIQTGTEGLTHIFPEPEDILNLKDKINEHLGKIGIIQTRSKTILELAQVFQEKSIDFNSCNSPEKEIKKLMNISGIGSWTAQYIAMRAMGWTDAFLETDYGVKKALAPRTSKEILALAEAWRPWRSYATVNLWNLL